MKPRSRSTVTIDGKPYGTGPIHDFIANYPRRISVRRNKYGWNACNRCGREHRVWMTDDHLWRRVPPPWRRRGLCTRCFRELVPEARSRPR